VTSTTFEVSAANRAAQSLTFVLCSHPSRFNPRVLIKIAKTDWSLVFLVRFWSVPVEHLTPVLVVNGLVLQSRCLRENRVILLRCYSCQSSCKFAVLSSHSSVLFPLQALQPALNRFNPERKFQISASPTQRQLLTNALSVHVILHPAMHSARRSRRIEILMRPALNMHRRLHTSNEINILKLLLAFGAAYLR